MSLITQNIEKIIVNTGIGRLRQQTNFEEKILPEIMSELALIAGQKSSSCPAKKSIASFKIRQGDIVGLRVTLRRKRMEDFLSRLINIILPRVRDFRGIDLKNIDAVGNLNIGLKDQLVFPEIDPNKSKVYFGVQATIVAKEQNRDKMIDFYRTIGVPLKHRK